jgi:cytochrome P450
MDDPRHAKLRLLVQKGFTPKTVAAVEQSVRRRARALMVRAADLGTCDFVETFAAPLPLQVICDMLGVPAADEKQIFDWTNVILGVGDPDFGAFDALFESALAMYNYAQALGQERLDHPGEDLVSLLMDACGVRVVLHPPGRGRQRDDAQRHQLGYEAAHRASRPAGGLAG